MSDISESVKHALERLPELENCKDIVNMGAYPHGLIAVEIAEIVLKRRDNGLCQESRLIYVFGKFEKCLIFSEGRGLWFVESNFITGVPQRGHAIILSSIEEYFVLERNK